jgi:hypothetical protein
MLFNYRLTPLEQVEGWDTDGRLELTWLTLSEGQFWIDTGTAELFRYSDAVVRKWAAEGYELPYETSFVAAYWHNLVDILPDVLEPVPHEVLRQAPPGWRTSMWGVAREVMHLWPRASDEAFSQLVYRATGWLNRRKFYSPGPDFWLWSDPDGVVTLHWDNERQREKDGSPTWAAGKGSVSMPVERFVAEVRDLDRRLLGEIGERIAQVRRHWPRPEISVDVEMLEREYARRSWWLDDAFQEPRPVRWDRVLRAITQLRHVHPLR